MKKIQKLLGYCPQCRKYFKYPKRRRTNASYENEEDNYTYECKKCWERTMEYLDNMWEDFYCGRGK